MSRWRLLGCLLLAAAGPGLDLAAETPVDADANANASLRLGFSSAVLVGLNETDAKAAIRLWSEEILMEHGMAVATQPLVLNGAEAIASAVRNKLVDGVTLTAEEYWAMGSAAMSTTAIMGVNAGQPTEEYLLLVRSDGAVGRIEDLRGRSLVFCQNSRDSLARVWFETLLLKSGLGETHEFCSRVTQGVKLAQTVLAVFFRQSDACVVNRRGFETMTELNPQVAQQLKVLASSSPMVPIAFFFRADYSDPTKDRIIAKVKRLHLTVSGQQVLTLFQVDGIDVTPASVLDSALELLATHARLIEAAGHAGPDRAGVPLANSQAKPKP